MGSGTFELGGTVYAYDEHEQKYRPIARVSDGFGQVSSVRIGPNLFTSDNIIFGDHEYMCELAYNKPFKIKKVIFNDPATIVLWADGTKTVVKCGKDDVYDKEKGLALCFMKKALDNKGNYNNVLKEHTK